MRYPKYKKGGFINLEGFINPMRNRTNRKGYRFTGPNYLSIAFFKSLFACKHKYIAENDMWRGLIFASRTMTSKKASDLYLKLKTFLRVVDGDSCNNYPKYHLCSKRIDDTAFVRLGYSNRYVIWDTSKKPNLYELSDAKEITFEEFIKYYNITIQDSYTLECV